MSKVDALRALREAKYAADRAAAPAGTPKKPAAARPVAATASKPARSARASSAMVEPAGEETEARCGHRNMGGKSCTRPENHSEKNHRYS